MVTQTSWKCRGCHGWQQNFRVAPGDSPFLHRQGELSPRCAVVRDSGVPVGTGVVVFLEVGKPERNDLSAVFDIELEVGGAEFDLALTGIIEGDAFRIYEVQSANAGSENTR